MSQTPPRFADQARQLRAAFDRTFAEPPVADAAPSVDLVAFRVGTEPYALRLSEIAGLFSDRKVTRVPSPLAAFIGLCSIRGGVAPVYDLHLLLGRAPVETPRWLALATGAAVALAFETFDGHLQVAREAMAPGDADERARRLIGEFASVGGFFARSCVCRPSSRRFPSDFPRPIRQGSDESYSEGWTFGRRLAAAFGFAGLVLLVIAAVGYRTTTALIENDGRLSHSYAVESKLNDLLSDLKDAETGQRGYLLTGDDNYLAPYQSALGEIRGTLDNVRELTVDNPDQQRRLSALAPLIDAKLGELGQTIDLRRTQGADAALAVVKTNAGKADMDKIRALIGAAIGQEDGLLAQRAQAAQSSAAWAKAVTLWGGLAGLLIIAATGWLMVRSLTQQIGSAVGQIHSSSAELQAAATQQATGAKEQSTATSEITTTISELLATSRQIAEGAQRVAQIAEQTAGAARSGHGTVDAAQGSIEGIRRQVDQIVADMLELGRKSQEIGSVLDIVSELAEQTNILAINATIEAAGAGDQGLRFGVVADEIRKLADRVAGSTKEIRTLIDDVRSAVNTTVMATETGSKAVEAGSRQFVDVASGFNEISNMVIATTDAAREIELSTKQQASAVEQVNVAIANVAQASKETEVSSSQTLLTASQLTALSTELSRLIQPKAAVVHAE